LGEAIEGVAREIVGCVKGRLTCSIAKYKPAFVPAVTCDHVRWLPRPTSKEKGIKNFTDAASQSQ